MTMLEKRIRDLIAEIQASLGNNEDTLPFTKQAVEQVLACLQTALTAIS